MLILTISLAEIKGKMYKLLIIMIYPAMTAFTNQYSLPNIFFDIGQL
jgi:hypothetical protein